jgi:hypothetical protein
MKTVAVVLRLAHNANPLEFGDLENESFIVCFSVLDYVAGIVIDLVSVTGLKTRY